MDTALLIEKLNQTHALTKGEALQLIREGAEYKDKLFALAQRAAQQSFGRNIFVRGLIEFTNYCKNDCYYCGIRRSNKMSLPITAKTTATTAASGAATKTRRATA